MPTKATDVLYGLNPAFETLLAGRRPIRRILMNRSAGSKPRMQTLVRLAAERDIQIDYLEKGRLIDTAGTHDHQGVVLECGPYPYTPLDDLLEKPRLVLIDNIQDPHNVGAIVRTAEVFGYDGVLLPTRGVPPVLPSMVKASAGATEHVAIARDHSANQYVNTAHDADYLMVALDAKGEHTFQDVRDRQPAKLMVVCGGEDKGVRQYIINKADAVVRIPQQGRISSLNASVAAAIALHELR